MGPPSGRPLLLIMALGGQMIWWDDDFCEELVAAGFFVIRFDNRDSGRSQDIGRPDAAPRRRSPGLERSKSTAWATIYPASLGRRSSNTSLRSRTAANTSTQCRPNATQTIEVLWPLVGHRHNKEEY
jgi:hypothetical protein